MVVSTCRVKEVRPTRKHMESALVSWCSITWSPVISTKKPAVLTSEPFLGLPLGTLARTVPVKTAGPPTAPFLRWGGQGREIGVH